MAQLFISDLHLSPQRPATIALFLRFLRERAAQAEALYILGDLFDAWIGDDYREGPIPEILDALHASSVGGTRLFFMHGNRDFLIGERFAAESGCELLADPYRLELAGQAALLMHGDLLCSDDHDYQQARRKLRDPAFIAQMLAQPIEARLALAADYRRRSGEATSNKAADIMDVNQQTVAGYLRAADARLLIHGHTHRPAAHAFTLDGAPARRIVLPDWQPDLGGYLLLDGARMERLSFS
ncbi:MAG: UDP-2,3-diacylglucosamine diphosphatase [Gammaproteobacteria bacterium]|nr:UDP-2,3-diacylglucosamine diphosphatase [Gammaproteobacteria bacterium]